jgi:hypothetical protein
MATPGFVQLVAPIAEANTATVTVTFTKAVAIGQTIVLICKSGTGHHLVSATDLAGNTWVIDTNLNVAHATVNIIRAYITHAISATGTLTVVFSASTSGGNAVAALQFTGIVPTATGPVTKKTNKSTTLTASITSSTITPTQKATVLVSGVSINATANTATPTPATFTRRFNYNAHKTFAAADWLLSSSAAHHIKWSWSTAATNSLTLIAYKLVNVQSGWWNA